jgi:hypothetical protein
MASENLKMAQPREAMHAAAQKNALITKRRHARRSASNSHEAIVNVGYGPGTAAVHAPARAGG